MIIETPNVLLDAINPGNGNGNVPGLRSWIQSYTDPGDHLPSEGDVNAVAADSADIRVFCPICGWEGKRVEGFNMYQCKREHKWIQRWKG